MLLDGLLELTTKQTTHKVCICTCVSVTFIVSRVYSHPLDSLLIDADAPEQSFEDLAEREGEEANGAELLRVTHLLQDGRRFLLDVISRSARLFGNLDNSK